MARLYDAVQKKEELQKEKMKEGEKKRAAVSLIISSQKKTKSVTHKFSPETYAEFTEICKLFGETNNSRINNLVTSFVLEHRYLLHQD